MKRKKDFIHTNISNWILLRPVVDLSLIPILIKQNWIETSYEWVFKQFTTLYFLINSLEFVGYKRSYSLFRLFSVTIFRL